MCKIVQEGRQKYWFGLILLVDESQQFDNAKVNLGLQLVLVF